MLWKGGLSKKNLAGIWSTLYYQERWYFFFHKISSYSLFFKMNFLKKCMEIWYFFQMPWKDGLSKNSRTGMWSVLYYLERRYFFSRKIWYFSFGWKRKDNLSQEIHGNMIFSVYMYNCYKYDNTILQKKQRWSSPKKIHLKVIDIPDCILERVLMILCTFIETFIAVFINCFPVKKSQQT